jgi:hypothetical protein
MSQPPISPPPPRSGDELPTLDPEVVDDDDALAVAVDAFIHQDPIAGGRQAEMVLFQEVVRRAVDADVWRTVLRVDELTTARVADLVVEIARWAFNAGRAFPLPPSSGNGVGS